MSDVNKSAWKNGLILIGFLAICGLGVFSWHLYTQVQALKHHENNPLTMNQPFNQPFANPWSNQNPQNLFDAMRKQMNKMMNSFSAQSIFPQQNSALFSAQEPEIQLKDGKSAYTVYINIPKGAKVNLNTELENHQLTVKGSVKDNVKNAHQQFSSVNQFSRTFYLADNVQQGDMRTTQSDNKIIITVPKA